MTRLNSLECVIWIMSAFIVTFMLVSLGKLHNDHEKEQATSLKFHPEGRRVLSLQHLSKEKISIQTKEQNMRTGPKFHDTQLADVENRNLPKEHVSDMAVDGNQPEENELGYADTVLIEDNVNDISNFEELDGFNYVKNKERKEADLKLSNNIRVEGNDVVVLENNQEDILAQKDTINSKRYIDPNYPNSWQLVPNSHHIRPDAADKTNFDEKISSQKRDLQLDDVDDMSLQEQQLLERNIVQHKPVKPNLPPEDEPYDAHMGNAQHNTQLHHYLNPQDNGPVKEGTGQQFFGDQLQFYAPNTGKRVDDSNFVKKFRVQTNDQQHHLTFNNNVMDYKIRLQQDQAEYHGHNPETGTVKPVKYDNLYDSQKLQPKGDFIRDDKYLPHQQVHQFQQQTAISLDPDKIKDNVQFVDKIIQQQSQYQQGNKEGYANQKSVKRRRRKRLTSKRSAKSPNNTASLESHKQDQFNNVNNMQSAFPISEKSSVLNVYMKPNGRLGNQMFEIASLYGIARRTGRKPFMSKYSDIYQIFTHANRTVAMGEAGGDLGILFEEKPGMFSNYLFSLPPTDLVICCYFQSWKYFEGYQSDIRKMFHFKGKIRKLARTIINKAKHVFLTQLTDQINQFGNTQTLTYIGVHVRRGDLQQEHHLRRGYRVASLTYFHKAMDYYRQRYPNTIFLVTSDDIEWCKVKLGSSDVFFVEGQHEAVDLAVLSMTNHTVISVGTFSWWAGWLAGGHVIYYRNWPTPRSEVAQQYEHDDYFLPKWKPMGD